jgi:OTU domain-containing protein 3
MICLMSCVTIHLLTSALKLYVWIDDNRTIVDMEADGNCLFRALSDQLYMDFGNMHADIRSDIADYLEAFEEDFIHFLVLEDEDEDAADFESYVYSMRQDGEWGGNLELVAAARLFW